MAKGSEGPDALKPKLYFRNSVPYEHEVIAYDQLHPELQKEIDVIRMATRISRVGVTNVAMLVLPSPEIVKSFGPDLETQWKVARMITGLESLLVPIQFGIVGNELKKIGEKHGEFTIPENIRMGVTAMYLPYYDSKVKTHRIPTVVRQIVERNESPFTRSDSTDLLEKYQYGIIDNEGNLVLMKHPQDETAKELTGWQMLKKMFAWKQPFQRTRFELQKPKIKEKVKQPWQFPRLFPAGARLALAPVRLRTARG